MINDEHLTVPETVRWWRDTLAHTYAEALPLGARSGRPCQLDLDASGGAEHVDHRYADDAEQRGERPRRRAAPPRVDASKYGQG